MTASIDDRTEWLETDGLGGFASGTTSGVRTRRYHALLLPATTPPTGRLVLVNGLDAWIETPGGSFALSTQRYAPDVLHPDGMSRIVLFEPEPWPTWTFETPDGVRVTQEIVLEHGIGTVVLRWSIVGNAPSSRLVVRPFLSGRDYHSMHHENAGFRFDVERRGDATTLRPYPGVPAITFLTKGGYRTHRTGIETFNTRPSANAASTIARISRRRASSNGAWTVRREKRC